LLNGYDFFISYTRSDDGVLPSGERYANALWEQLEASGFHCFLDCKGFAPDDLWKWLAERKRRNTSQLVVVASPQALEASAVVDEVELFSKKESGRIIPIDFGDTIKQRDSFKPIFQHLRGNRIRWAWCCPPHPTLQERVPPFRQGLAA
jgi:hypothetical protein